MLKKVNSKLILFNPTLVSLINMLKDKLHLIKVHELYVKFYKYEIFIKKSVNNRKVYIEKSNI